MAETEDRLERHLSPTSTDPDDARTLQGMLEPFHTHLAWDGEKPEERMGELEKPGPATAHASEVSQHMDHSATALFLTPKCHAHFSVINSKLQAKG